MVCGRGTQEDVPTTARKRRVHPPAVPDHVRRTFCTRSARLSSSMWSHFQILVRSLCARRRVKRRRALVAWNLKRISVQRGASQGRLTHDANVDRSYVGGLVGDERAAR